MISISKPVEGLKEVALVRFVRRVQKAIGLTGQVSVLLTSNREMRRLNRSFRGKDKPTDVISFPAAEAVADEVAGDLAISVDIARANARALGHSTEEEIRILLLHGMLHLAGYDHEVDNGRMARKEAALRARIGLPATLIERTVKAPRKRTKARVSR